MTAAVTTTLAATIRAHAAQYPDLSPTERARVLASELGHPVSRQAVQRALAYQPTGRAVGRPREHAQCPTCGQSLPADDLTDKEKPAHPGQGGGRAG